MMYLQIAGNALRNAGFSKVSQASCYFPANDNHDHIHLGTPTSYLDGGHQHIAADGYYYVTFVSFKRNGQTWFRMHCDGETGRFSFPNGDSRAKLIRDYPAWWNAIEQLNIVMD